MNYRDPRRVSAYSVVYGMSQANIDNVTACAKYSGAGCSRTVGAS